MKLIGLLQVRACNIIIQYTCKPGHSHQKKKCPVARAKQRLLITLEPCGVTGNLPQLYSDCDSVWACYILAIPCYLFCFGSHILCGDATAEQKHAATTIALLGHGGSKHAATRRGRGDVRGLLPHPQKPPNEPEHAGWSRARPSTSVDSRPAQVQQPSLLCHHC